MDIEVFSCPLSKNKKHALQRYVKVQCQDFAPHKLICMSSGNPNFLNLQFTVVHSVFTFAKTSFVLKVRK